MTARLTDAAGNASANSTATPVTVDTAAPTATVAITAIATDSGTSSSDYVTNDTTLTVSGTHGPLGAGETVQVSSDGGASWADATSTASTWSYADPTTHGTSFTYQVRIVDAVGNVDANTDSQAVTIDTAAPTAPSITVDPGEWRRRHQRRRGLGRHAGGGRPGGHRGGAGDTLTVNWGGQTVTYTLLAADISGSSATVTVPARDDRGAGPRHVRRDGQADRRSGQRQRRTRRRLPVTVDTVAPTAAVAITAIATDSGTSSSDYVTNDTTLTVSGTHGPLGAGETVQVSSDGGASWADVTTSTASTWSYTDPTTHGTSFTYQVRIVDTVGNVDANTASQAVTIDTVAPTAPSITVDPGEWRRRHQRRRGLERHAGGGGPGGHRGGGGRHADRQLGQPDGHLHAPGGRHLGQQRDGDGACRRRSRRRARARST